MNVIEEEIYIRALECKESEVKKAVKDIANKYGGKYVDMFHQSRKKFKDLQQIN